MSTLRVDSLQGQTTGTDRYVVQVKQAVKTDRFETQVHQQLTLQG